MPTPDAWLNHADDARKREGAPPLTQYEAGTSVVDLAYAERNKLVAALWRLTNWPLWVGLDPDAPGFMVIYLESGSGQLSWHMREAEARALFPAYVLEGVAGTWDGHTTAEKYDRLARAVLPVAKYLKEK
jgi:hypothetical protein